MQAGILTKWGMRHIMRADAPGLNILAEFKDPALERAFFRGHIISVRFYIAYASLLVGVLYFLLGFFDIFILGMGETAVLNVVLRACIALCGVAVFLTAKNASDPMAILYSYLCYAVLLVVSYQSLLYIHYGYGYGVGFVELAMGFLIIDLVCFLLPNRWIYSLVFAVGVAVMFLLVTSLYMEDMPPHQPFGVIVYFVFVVVFGGMFSRSLHVQRRMHFYRERQLEHLSNTDRLTGVYNRQKFDEVFTGWLSRTDEEAGFSVIMFDLDRFKKLNDTYGHLFGDEVLVASVDAVRGAIRSRDILARWGGEEFMILLPATPLDAAVNLAERLRSTIEQIPFAPDVHVTASFGVIQRQPGDTTDTMITRVDACMYRAKAEGRNRVCADPDGPGANGGGQAARLEENGRHA